jgi:hypothetical protein
VEDGLVVYDKMLREEIIKREKENRLRVWQQQWTDMGKGAVAKAFLASSITKGIFSRNHNLVSQSKV